MAKYTITYACGHTEGIALFGPEKKRKATIARKEQDNCAACAAKAAALSAEAAGLPVLTGSDKQVAWAEGIRRELLSNMERDAKTAAESIERVYANLADAEKVAAVMTETGKTADQIAEEVERRIADKRAIVNKYERAKTETTARWWIDNR